MSKEKIIVALDVPTADQAQEIIRELSGEVGAFKIGLQLFVAAGADFVRKNCDAGNKIFLDLKFHDIPQTVANTSIEAARLGVWMFNVHAAGGSEMMRRAGAEVKEFCEKENLNVPKIIAVTVLTSSNDETLRETGIEANAEEQVTKLAELTAISGLDGVVASPHEVIAIRQNIEKENFLIVTPGIRNGQVNFKNQDRDDQKRIMSAAEAFSAGSDYLVIGRPITQSENRIKAVREILGDVEKQLIQAG
jgi:orotidine-5'-phosphate decarboxylase